MKRGRNQRRRQGVNPNRALDSNGPDVRIRGTANQIYDKYQALARDATSSGDRVKAENYLQHAEHYYRLIRAMQPDRPLSDSHESDGEQDNDSQPQSSPKRPGRSRPEANGRDHRAEPTGDTGDDGKQKQARSRHDADQDNDDGADKVVEPSDTSGEASGDAGKKIAERKPRRKKRVPRVSKSDGDDAAPSTVKEEEPA